MNFNVNNKKVEVIIPDEVPKLKPEIVEEVYAKYNGEDVYEALKKYKRKDHYYVPVKTIGIWMSGNVVFALETHQIQYGGPVRFMCFLYGHRQTRYAYANGFQDVQNPTRALKGTETHQIQN